MDGRFIGARIASGNSVDSHYLLLGICGAGMRALAEILLDAGHRVTGTDRQLITSADIFHERSRWPATERDLGSPRSRRLRPELITWDCAASMIAQHSDERLRLVVSAAVPDDDERLQTSRKRNFTTQLLTEALAEQFRHHHQVCVAGTHGKSTSTGLLWWILAQSGLNPAGFVGGQMLNTSRCGFSGAAIRIAGGATPPLAVLESCEYRRAFCAFSPSTVLLTGIERDHFDCFPTSAEEDSAFRAFANRISNSGHMVVNRDCPRATSLAIGAMQPDQLTTFGLKPPGHEWDGIPAVHWTAGDLRHSVAGASFEVSCETSGVPHVESAHVALRIPGIHNIRNSLGAIATASKLGVPLAEIATATAGYLGIRRRFEHRGVWNGMDLIDDYAHHPSAIRATLEAARLSFPRRRLIAVLEPHQLSRTEQLFSEFRKALMLADEILLLPVLAAREQATAATCCRTSGRLVREINSAGGRAFLAANLDQAIARIDHSGRPGDVVITMGAGRTNQIHDEFNRRLQRDSAA